MSQKPRRKSNALAFLMPYIVLIGLVVVLIVAFGGQTKTVKEEWNPNPDAISAKLDMIYDETKNNTAVMDQITIYEKERVLIIEGQYTKDKTTYVFSVQTSSTVEEDVKQIYDAVYQFGNKVVVYNAFESSIWDVVISWIPTLLMMGLLMFFLFRTMSANSNNKAFDFGKSPVKSIENSKIRFADVAGCDEEKQEMQELVDYLKHPQKYTSMGARIPKGVLLTGSPGTGKTLLAKAVAGEAEVPFFFISGSDFVEMFVGVGASRVRDMFRRAKQHAPSLLFIDEIDAVGRQRGTGVGGGHDEREQTLNQLLVEMDSFSDNSGVIIIAATNRPDVLDPALLRPGRFDRQITVALPDMKGREEILKVHSRNKKVSSEVNLKNIAMRTPGFSGAELENIMNEAAILAARFNKKEIDMTDIDEAIDRVHGGLAKKSQNRSAEETRIVAYHEAGHALAGLKLKNAMKVQKVTIIPRGDAGGYVLMTPENDKYNYTKRELMDRISGLLAGRVAEELFFDDITTGASSDIEQSTRLARRMVTEFGMSNLGPIKYEEPAGNAFLGRDYANAQRNISSEVAFEIDQEIKKIINTAYETVKKVILDNRDQLILIAETLLTKEILTNEEVVSLVETGALPNEAKKDTTDVDIPPVDVEVKGTNE